MWLKSQAEKWYTGNLIDVSSDSENGDVDDKLEDNEARGSSNPQCSSKKTCNNLKRKAVMTEDEDKIGKELTVKLVKLEWPVIGKALRNLLGNDSICSDIDMDGLSEEDVTEVEELLMQMASHQYNSERKRMRLLNASGAARSKDGKAREESLIASRS